MTTKKLHTSPIDRILTAVDRCDDWTQSSALGSIYYATAAAAVNAAMRIVSANDVEEGSGIDGFARYMERVAVLEPQQWADLYSLASIADKVANALNKSSSNEASFETHIAFRTSDERKPTRESVEADYAQRRRSGERFKESKAEWVSNQFTSQMAAFEKLKAHAQEAVTMLNRCLRDDPTRAVEDWESQYIDTPNRVHDRPEEFEMSAVEWGRVPDYLMEHVMDKALAKLYDRREKTETFYQRPKMSDAIKNSTLGDLFNIEAALVDLGETPPPFEYLNEDGEVCEWGRLKKKGTKYAMEYSKTPFA